MAASSTGAIWIAYAHHKVGTSSKVDVVNIVNGTRIPHRRPKQRTSTAHSSAADTACITRTGAISTAKFSGAHAVSTSASRNPPGARWPW